MKTKRFLSLLMTLALCLSLVPLGVVPAGAADGVAYIDRHWDESTSTVASEEKTCIDYTTVTDQREWGATGQETWYVVNGTVSADGGIDAYYHTSDWMSNFGAGSGGTVFLFGETFTGGANAKITAKGGDGLQRKNGNNVSATGGGGRIAIWTGYGIHESGTFHTHKRTECPFEFSGSFSAAAGERLVPTNGTQTHTAEELAFSIGGAGTVPFGEYVRIPGARFIIR